MMVQGERYQLMNEWTQQVLIPILQDQFPNEEIINHLGGIALLSADTDKIKEYVFESAKLPEIRGASMMLDDLNQGWPQRRDYQLFDARPPSNLREIFLHYGLPTRRNEDDQQVDCIIYVGGGSLLALVPLSVAEALKSEIETLYPYKTGAATISCVLQTITASGSKHIDFHDMIARQSLLLRRAKEEKDPLPFFEAIPFARRCESCQIRPAVKQVAPDERWLCQPCKIKANRSNKSGGKKWWTREFVNELLADSLECDQDAYLNGIMPEELGKLKGADNFNEIALASHDERTIGFIYADGNDIGRLIEDNSTSILEYRTKSKILHNITRTAVFKALGCHLSIKRGISRHISESVSKVDIHPFEIITIGGDDALIIVPGDKALDVSITIIKTFEDLAKKEKLSDHKYVTLSVGFVVADSHNPVYFLRSLAEDLLKNAKKKNRKLAEEGHVTPEGTLDFQILKSQTALSTDLNDLRAHRPWTITFEKQREKAILTSRPYTWREMEKLKCIAQATNRGLSSTQLQALCQSLHKGYLASREFYLYQWARADDDRKNLLKWIEWMWGMQTNNRPWIKLEPKGDYDRYSTIWEDIREIKDLVPPLNDEEWRELIQYIDHKTGGEPIHAS